MGARIIVAHIMNPKKTSTPTAMAAGGASTKATGGHTISGNDAKNIKLATAK